MATITLKGNEIHTSGDLPAVGSSAPDFVLTTGELADVSLDTYAGKKKLLNIRILMKYLEEVMWHMYWGSLSKLPTLLNYSLQKIKCKLAFHIHENVHVVYYRILISGLLLKAI